MKRRAAFVLLVSLGATGLLMAQKIKMVPPTLTAAGDGKDMYVHYCASCHGTDGKGNGPAATALKATPTDLTRLAVNHKGAFPEDAVKSYIKGADAVAAHGTRDMPVWGAIFKNMGSPNDTTMIDIRVNVLAQYIKSMQVK